MKKIKRIALRILVRIKAATDKIKLPGLNGHSLYDVTVLFIKGMIEGAISMRAASVAYSFFIAIFPTLIFFLSLIPFIPIDNFQYELFGLLENVLPVNAYNLFYDTISDTLMNQRSSVLSIGFLLMLIFSSNGIVALIDAFNTSYHEVNTRNFVGDRLISLLLVIIMSILLIIAITLIVMGGRIFDIIVGYYPKLDRNSISILYFVIKWLTIIFLFFLAISFLYYLAPAKKSRFRFFTPGAAFSTITLILAVYIFAFYVNNFSHYNKLYGSIGTVIVVMLLFYIIAMVLIVGFELNISTNIVKSMPEQNKKDSIKASAGNIK
ncbi:MAG: YihY/virulence factor BrkB family protein [Bacteroidales bacterium]|jgi:membrane protein|nr:YihY/virulence factor BrkB family protein [Bacteroidales bacterium]